MKSTDKIYGVRWELAFGAPLFVLILAIYLLCGAVAARGETNSLPPMPPYAPTPDSEAGIELQRQIKEAAEYAASLRPSPRVLMEDGRIIKWSAEAIEWHIEKPCYRVEWRASLTEGEWKRIGFRTGDTFTHRNPEGYYRVIPCKRPTKPPTLPAKRVPTNCPPSLVKSAPALTTTNYTKRYGGFRKR